MFQGLIDDLRDGTGRAMRQTLLAIAAAALLFVTTCFLCAGAFVFVLQKFGLLQACFAGAGVFFAATLMAWISYAIGKRKKKPAPPAEKTQPKSAATNLLQDPMVMAMALQAVRTVGFKRLLPILAVGGIALGVMSQRKSGRHESDDDA